MSAHPLASAPPSVRGALRRIAAGVLRVPEHLVDPGASFSTIGLDSLMTAELITAIEDELGVTLPAAALYEHPSLDALARWVARGQGTYEPPPPDETLRAMHRDAVLPRDIRPGTASEAGMSGCVLVTGVTGFVGAHLVRALLDGGTSRVACLVRGPRGGERVRGNMERYGVWRAGDDAAIDVVEGDLAEPRLGLDEPTAARLSGELDAIYHAGAAVDWVQPYSALRDCNVTGTLELLRLASARSPVPFHFLSSLAVCYSTLSTEAGEQLDAMTHAAGVHLGYAQSKVVAEALVREAGRRGLPVRIIRPALIAGEGRSGISNVDDLIALMIRGCVHMGAAPDLDWTLDAVPVDHVARCVTRLGQPKTGRDDVVHLVNPGARNWRECVLFLRLRGHPMRLLPYADWARLLQLAPDDRENPLHALRGFLLRRAPAADIFFPELYSNERRTDVRSHASLQRTAASAGAPPPLDAALLERYTTHFEHAGVMRAPSVGRRRAGASPLAVEPLRVAVEARLAADHRDRNARATLRAVKRLETSDSIVAELTSWSSGAPSGLFLATVDATAGGAGMSFNAVVKAKCEDRHVLDVAESVAALCDPALGAVYQAYREASGFVNGHRRELALYEQDDPRWRAFTPRLLGAAHDAGTATWLLALERITDAVVLDVDAHTWTPAQITTVLDGLAHLHAIWYGRSHELPDGWLAPRRTAASMERLQPLWSALARHAAPLVHAAGGDAFVETHRRLALSAGEWWRMGDGQVRTLIHNDFNPRNIMLRRTATGLRLCAYDWELAAVGLPQRDVAELLCFVLTPESSPHEAPQWMAHARAATAAATGCEVDPVAWERGFIVALREILVDRFASYAMVHRLRRQHFLPRILRTWNTLHSSLAS